MPRNEDVKADVISALERLARERHPPDEADAAADFVRQYYSTTAASDLASADVGDLYGAALSHRELMARRRPGEAVVRVVAPRFEVHGWSSTHASVMVVVDDMSFVVDSVRMAITTHGVGIHVLHHPIIDGVSLVHVEVDRHAIGVADELRETLLASLDDVRVATEDWARMVDDLRASAEQLRAEGAQVVPDDELDEALAFLDWLTDDNFTFLGVRSYDVDDDGTETIVRRVPGSGMGILRDGRARHGDEPGAADRISTKLSPRARALTLQPAPLTLTKANSFATVHRLTELDYIGVRRFDEDGRVVGERRYLGLYGSSMYTSSVRTIPVLRRKIEIVHQLAGFRPGSHSDKDLQTILETYPRDELVQVRPEALMKTAVSIHELHERRRTHLFLRQDDYGRFWSVLVYLPRERYNTDTRVAVEEILTDHLRGTRTSFHARLSESTLARLHFVVWSDLGDRPVDVDVLETSVAIAVRDWIDDLRLLLIENHGEDAGVLLAQRYRDAFSAGYRAENPSRVAVADIVRLEALGADGIDFHLSRQFEAPPDEFRLRVHRTGPEVLVSDLVPVLEDLGVRVIDQRPYRIRPEGSGLMHVYDIGMHVHAAVDVERDGQRIVDALAAVWDRRTESDGFHQLVLTAGLTWREAARLRAGARYLRQGGLAFSAGYVQACITAHPDVARALVELFDAKFCPPGDPERTAAIDAQIVELLDEVESLDDDRVLRAMLCLFRATLRTNAYQTDEHGEPKPYLSLKLDPAEVPELPLPLPHREIFVYSPRTEGVHLRGSPVARGGIRWSDRREDYRTEVLGLMKAQMVKNAVIVPAGAKGGFVAKELPIDPELRRDEVVACYTTFINGMLDVTDDLDGTDVVPPRDVVRLDDDDPYLVVAADKGTATFSDIANGIALERGFWLGDAFASGGSDGYDHKAMGITARGAWESVKRHFRELGVDVQAQSVTAVGIGDMAGDVFGNGMLLSEHLCLVAAFNHQHVFLDPAPDPAVSFAERRRLYHLPRSSWDDYDRSVISAGGGIYPRSAKSIPLSPEVQELLEVDAAAMTPNALINAILRAPVDLLWNGGIGTYVKASSETHADVGDKANDNVRVDGDQLRCRVVGEGGNLGFTQAGRVQFARRGGRINTDAIDNSAGVDCSDHEVNIKIVLDAVVAAGDLTTKQRNDLLVSMTDEVADLVLADNIRQNQALMNAFAQAPSLIDVHQRYLRWLENNGWIDRTVEVLPSDEELAERKAEGTGLTSPEFAVLLAYTKNLLVDDLLESEVPDDPWCEGFLVGYFPMALRERFVDQIRSHRLRREIVATVIVNQAIDQQGITSLFRIRDETGASASSVTRAVLAASEIFRMPAFQRRLEALTDELAASPQTRMLLDGRRLVERAARWLLRARAVGRIGDMVERFRPGADELVDEMAELLVGGEREAYEATVAERIASGVPEDLARRVATFDELLAALDCVELSELTGAPVTTVAAVRFQLEERLGLRWLMHRIVALPRDNRWQSLARLSLREDLHAQLTRLTGDVLASSEATQDPGARVRKWCASNEPGVARLMHVLADIRAASSADLATLSVGLREVTQLA